MIRIDKIEHANQLPQDWNDHSQNLFQKMDFLIHCETYNPCNQRYYILSSNNTFLCGAVVYTLKLDLLTFLNLPSPVTVKIIGIPCSVSSSGLVGLPANYKNLLDRLWQYERGLFLCLNLESIPSELPGAIGHTLPSVILLNQFATWEHYLGCLRSDYRRRINQVMKYGDDCKLVRVSCDHFDEELYDMYCQVYRRSKEKLEKLNLEFFRNLAGNFTLNIIYRENKLKGWTITSFDNGKYWFLLGGQNYGNDAKSLYLFMLMDIIKSGIKANATAIDLGQSAEIPKLRFGGICEERYMTSFHSQVLLNFMLRQSISILSYKNKVQQHHVFKTNTA